MGLVDSTAVRQQFPALAAQPRIAYLDSASTAQKPAVVIDAMSRYLSDGTANTGRGTYPWANRVTRAVHEVRERVAAFIGAAPDEIVFTAGATASLNAVALSWGLANLTDGDEILYSPLDHASAVQPWRHLQRTLGRFGIKIKLLPYAVTGAGEADLTDLRAHLGPRTRLIVASHLHHVFGALTTLEELDHPMLRCFDCSQSAGHVPIDVGALRADFAVFSAHKLFGAPGTGVLYANRRTHAQLAPFLPGGNTGTAMPARLEGGTPNVAGILALGAAIGFVDGIGLDAIAAHDRRLTRRLIDRLRAIAGVELLPGVAAASCEVGYGIVSCTVEGVSAADVGFIAAAHDLYVRTGTHCLPDASAGVESVRVSTHVYTGTEEIDRFAGLVEQIAKEAPRP
jgi:cysteine desulfurase/selenocysteine lyase